MNLWGDNLEEVKKKLNRIKVGMHLVDTRMTAKGIPMTADSFKLHMDFLSNLMKELNEFIADNGFAWEEVFKAWDEL